LQVDILMNKNMKSSSEPYEQNYYYLLVNS
jgi:hypothetical protein